MDDDETLHRRARLRELIRACFDGKPANLLRHIQERTGRAANQGELSAIQKDHGGKSFGDKKAKTLTEQIGLHRRWFDMPLGSNLEGESWQLDAPSSRDEPHAAANRSDDLSLSDNVHRLVQPAQSTDSQKGDDMGAAQVVSMADRARAGEFVIPQYAAGGAMGHGLVLPEQPGVIERWTVSNEWLEKNVRNYTAKKNLCIVTGFGPSMQPMFNPGDPLLVDTGITRVHADGVYFFRIGDEGYIKQLQKLPKPGGGVIYRAKSANPAYDTFDIDGTYDFAVLGKVVRVWCGTDF